MRPALPLLRPVAAVAVLLAVLACAAAASRPAAPPATPAPAGPWLWVSNEGSGDVALVDAASGEVVSRVPVGTRPRGLRLARDGGLLYAAVSGSPAGNVAAPVRSAADRGVDGIAVVDVVTRRVVSILPSGHDPENFDLVPGGRLLVVSSEETASAAVVDLEAGRIAARVGVGAGPAGVTAAPDGGLVAIAGAHSLELVDPVAGRVVGRVRTCARPRAAVFTPDGALAFAACEEGAAVAVVDTVARAPAGEIALPAGSRPLALALAPDGRRLFVSNGRAGTVSAVDVPSRRVLATSAPFGDRAGGIALAPDGARLYVADGPANAVAVLDARTLELVGRIPEGELPCDLAVVP
jgi:YVTN family beta-propeller protein